MSSTAGFRWSVAIAGALAASALFGLDWLLGHALREEIQASTEIANQTFTRAFVNEEWETIRPMLGIDAAPADPRANQHLPQIDARVRGFARGTDLVKVKIYDPRGLTVYSSDPAQIGEEKSGNAGFLGAARGRTMSELTFRGKFGSFDGEIHQRNLVSSYVPVRGPSGVEAVVEIYTDRTASIESIQRRQRALMLWGAPLALVVFAAFVAFARAGRRRSAADTDAGDRAEARAAGELARLRLVAIESSGFLASIANELSHPLDALDRSLGQAMAEQPAHGALERACSAAGALRKRAEWIDLLARAGHSGVSVAPGATDPAVQVSGAIDAVAPRAQSKGIELQAQFGPGLGKPVAGDSREVTAILEAILSDAIDATDEGFVHVKVNASADGVQFDVIDSGRSRESLRHTGSHRLDPEVSEAQDAHGSTGPEPIGTTGFRLVLAQGLVRRLGGEFRASATSGAGNWVTFTLPLAQSPSVPEAPPRAGG